MKTVATNLPTLPTNVRVRKVRGQNKLELVFVAPQVEEIEEEVVAVESAAYIKAAKELDAAVEILAEVFEPRKVRRPISVPTSASAAAIIASAKIYSKPLPQAPKIDYSQKGSLGSQGFSLLR